mgnify:CR=1 FL=1
MQKKSGRPPLPKSALLGKQRKFALPEREWNVIVLKAREEGLNGAQWVRRVVRAAVAAANREDQAT